MHDDDFVLAADRIYALKRGYAFASRSFADDDIRGIARDQVYNLLQSFPVRRDVDLTPETIRVADRWFDEEILPRLSLTADGRQVRKKDARLTFFRLLIHAMRRAMYATGCVRYARGFHASDKIEREVVEAAVAVGLFHEHRSPKGSPKMSRLLPLYGFRDAAPYDAVEFDPAAQPATGDAPSYVVLRRRKDKSPIAFDPAEPVAAEYQRRLERINAVIARQEITVARYREWDDRFAGYRRLRPILFAVFTRDFDSHGRLYTRRHGHQSLRPFVRQTIEFDGEACFEADFGGLHPRLLYHRAGIDYAGDPYALWGDATTKPMRLLAKKVVNAAINARSKDKAISACNKATRLDGKSPKKRAEAVRLLRARKATGLAFADIYERAKRVHAPIADSFGSDAGLSLMRTDGTIALDVCDRFARLGVPCLPCHDSFVVPQRLDLELLHVMQECYETSVGFAPVIKPVRKGRYAISC